MMYIFTVCYDGGRVESTEGLQKDVAEMLYEYYEQNTPEDVAWFGIKPMKG